ncbi:11957_t:CDS:2, partial [Ambispora leptoticha]
ESVQRRLDRKLRREERRQLREQKRQELERELAEQAEERRRERQATLEKFEEGDKKDEAEYQEWVEKINTLQEEGDKERERIEQELQEEINKTREEREERQRSTEKRTFTPPQDSNLFPKISMVDLSQVQLRSSRRSAQKPNVTSPSHDPTVTEDLAVSSKNPPQNSSSIEESEQQKTNTENVKEEEEILNTSNESNNNNNDKDVPENSKKLASIITSGVKLTEYSEETPLTAEPQEIEVVLTWESKKNANQTPTPTNVNDDLLIVKEARKDTIDAFNTDTAEKEDKKVESQAQSKIVEESEIKLSDESEGIEKVTGKLPPKVPISPTATSTTT